MTWQKFGVVSFDWVMYDKLTHFKTGLPGSTILNGNMTHFSPPSTGSTSTE